MLKTVGTALHMKQAREPCKDLPALLHKLGCELKDMSKGTCLSHLSQVCNAGGALPGTVLSDCSTGSSHFSDCLSSKNMQVLFGNFRRKCCLSVGATLKFFEIHSSQELLQLNDRRCSSPSKPLQVKAVYWFSEHSFHVSQPFKTCCGEKALVF